MPTLSDVERWRRQRAQGRFRLFAREALIWVAGAVATALGAAVWSGSAMPSVLAVLVSAAVALLYSAFTAARQWDALVRRLADLDIRGARCLRCGQVDPVHADWCPENEPVRFGWLRRRA